MDGEGDKNDTRREVRDLFPAMYVEEGDWPCRVAPFGLGTLPSLPLAIVLLPMVVEGPDAGTGSLGRGGCEGPNLSS